jgi:hypothetical protein
MKMLQGKNSRENEDFRSKLLIMRTLKGKKLERNADFRRKLLNEETPKVRNQGELNISD